MTRPLNFRELQALRAVVLSGSTVEAAQLLHTSQPSISRLLSQAQKATGLRIFDNEKGRLRPTREGLRLFEAIQQNFLGMEKIEQIVRTLRESGDGLLRVACTPTVGLGVLPAVIKRFSAAWPKVRFNIATLETSQIRDELRYGMHDIAITNNPLEGSEFDCHSIFETEAVCIFPPGHPLTKYQNINVEMFPGHIRLCIDANDSLEIEVRRRLEDRKGPVAHTLATTYSTTICVFAAQGMGLGVVNPYIASVFKDRVVIRKLVPSIKVTTYISLPRFSPTSELVDKFSKTVVDRLKEEDWFVSRG